MPDSDKITKYIAITENTRLVALGIFFACIAWLHQGYTFGHGNHGQEVPPILAIIDQTLYTKDFSVQDFLLLGPRYFYYTLVAWLSIFLKVEVDLVLLLIKTVCQILFYLAVVFIFRSVMERFHEDKFKTSTRNIIFYGFFAAACTFNILSWGSAIFYQMMVPSTLAMAIGIWSFYFAIKRKWIFAFLICAVAVLIQFLVGLFSALVLIPGLIHHSIKIKSFKTLVIPLIILAIPVLGIYLSAKISNEVTPENFNFLYVFGVFRVPHHWLPSTGSIYQWLSDFFLLIGALFASFNLWKSRKADIDLILLLTGVIFVSATGVLLNILFVEFYPVELIGKLQFQRIIPFAHIAIFLLIFANFYTLFTNKRKFITKQSRFLTILSVVATASSLFSLTFLKPFPGALFVLNVLFILAFISYAALRTNGRVFMIGLSFTILVFVNTSSIIHTNESLAKVSSRYKPGIDGDWEGREISVWLKNNSPKDTLVIIPPDWNIFSDILALHSQRSIFFSFKNVPYSDLGVWVWSKRAQYLLDVEISPALDRNNLKNLWSKRSIHDIEEIAKDYGACFLVDRMEVRSQIGLDLKAVSQLKNNERWGLWEFVHCAN